MLTLCSILYFHRSEYIITVCSGLPQHLLDLIMQKLEAEGGMRSVALLRQVCKAWHAAFSAYPGSVRSRSTDMASLLRVAPSMVSLELPRFGFAHTDMQPISSNTHLRSLSNTHLRSLLLSGPSFTRAYIIGKFGEAGMDQQLYLDLSLLPPRLRKLAVDTVYVLPSSFARINSPGLESLEFCWAQNSEKEVATLLQCLPQLKVRLYHKKAMSHPSLASLPPSKRE